MGDPLGVKGLVFSHLSKVLFSGFLQFKGNLVNGQNNSKYHDLAPLTWFSVIYSVISKMYGDRYQPFYVLFQLMAEQMVQT